MNRVIIILSGIFLISCGSRVNFNLPSGDLEINIYEEAILNVTCSVSAGSLEYSYIQNWLSRNQAGWHKSPASYLPKKLVTGSGFKAQILERIIVINDLWVHEIDDEFYESIKCP